MRGSSCIMKSSKCRSKSNKIQQVECCSKRSFQKIKFFSKKENSGHVFEKRQFLPTFKRPFYKKDSLAHYLSYATLMYLFWELSNSSFRAGLFLTVSSQTGLNWFLLSLQTAKPSDKKIYCRFHHQYFWCEYFSVNK